jgi:hypothetical protein
MFEEENVHPGSDGGQGRVFALVGRFLRGLASVEPLAVQGAPVRVVEVDHKDPVQFGHPAVVVPERGRPVRDATPINDRDRLERRSKRRLCVSVDPRLDDRLAAARHLSERPPRVLGVVGEKRRHLIGIVRCPRGEVPMQPTAKGLEIHRRASYARADR